ncbi:DNA polymerase III subunit delta [Mycoplasmopsis pullorum]|uniref:DNA polymerase III subunit delta n=1 Tax=Mycoplasmopsis pullorum TaxID=48003 RepID=UPI001119B761|nr:DNA polymerase III subunit delta [Mycoplasmopsis pullorum]TNK82928.1 DNA polymerase III subunit delta [Mycoplasmopsis pullorum]TNK91926.1 DNA polymerase III subunit delta [Mycoplasmopsis pullorum]
MYLLFGEETYFINQELNNIKNNFSKLNIEDFDNYSNLIEIVNRMSSFSLFSEPKLYIFRDFPIFNDSKAKIEGIDYFLNYLKEKNDQNEIVFIHNDTTIAKNSFTNFILANFKVIETKKIKNKDLPKVLVDYVNACGGKLTISDALLLTEILPNDLSIIISEIDKLLLEDKNITIDIINKSVPQYNSDDTFAFSNSIESGDFVLIWSKYKERLHEGDTILQMIGQISRLFCLASKINSFKNLDFTLLQIATYLKIHEFRIKKANNLLMKFGIRKIEEIINTLSNLEYDLKTKGVYDEQAFEVFLIKYFGNN